MYYVQVRKMMRRTYSVFERPLLYKSYLYFRYHHKALKTLSKLLWHTFQKRRRDEFLKRTYICYTVNMERMILMSENDLLLQILNELKTTNERLNKLELNQKTLKNDITTLKMNQEQIKVAVLETNSIVKRTDASLKQTSKTVQLLSHRSIEQEAILKDFQ